MTTWIPEQLELLKAIDRQDTPKGNINCATYLAMVDNISKVYGSMRGSGHGAVPTVKSAPAAGSVLTFNAQVRRALLH